MYKWLWTEENFSESSAEPVLGKWSLCRRGKYSIQAGALWKVGCWQEVKMQYDRKTHLKDGQADAHWPRRLEYAVPCKNRALTEGYFD